jgi:hypothetical protein
MATDANLVLQTSVTKTAAFDGAGVDLKVGTPRRGLKARVRYSAASTSSGSGAATFKIQESDDNSAWRDLTTFDALTLSTTAASGLLFESFETSARYVRLSLAAISGTGATVTYDGDIMLARP